MNPIDLVSQILVSVLKPKGYLGKVYIFGSRAREDQRPSSDLDLLFELEPALEMDTRLDLMEKFATSDLPFKVDCVSVVDLVPEFQPSVMKDRKLLIEL